MKALLILITFFISVNLINAQSQERIKTGIELDVLPYITGGYFGAVWARKMHFGVRALYAKVNMPDFIVPEGFANNKVQSYALIIEYFLKKEQKGFWIGSGLVLWNGKIQTELQKETGFYHSLLLNGSIGYSIDLNRRFYLSPWAGLSLRISGDRNIFIDGQKYDPPVLNPELSLKFGFKF
jgi:hypothetical protein